MFDKEDQPDFLFVLLSCFIFAVGISLLVFFSEGDDTRLSIMLRMTVFFFVYYYVATLIYSFNKTQPEEGVFDTITVILTPLMIPYFIIGFVAAVIDEKFSREA